MTLSNQDTSVVYALCQTKLVNAGLETTFKEILHFERQDVIELHARFVEHTNTDETTNQGIAFEETLGVFLIERKKLTRTRLVSYL